MSRTAIRDAIAGLYVNHVGQEGRGAAVSVRDAALRVLDEQWAAEDAAERRRVALLAALRAQLKAAAVEIPGLNAADYVADSLTGSLAEFVLSLDDRTWAP